MELDEIKTVWNELNNRLEKTEILNKRLITDMLTSRQQSAKDKLMKYEVSFFIFSLVFTLLTWIEYLMGIFSLPTSLLFGFVFIASAFWQVYKIYLLRQMKIDIRSTAELLQKAIRFKVITRMRTVVGLIMLIPIFALIFILDKSFNTAPMIVAVCVGGGIGLVIGLILFFRNLKDIDSLVKSYKDIGDFEKE
jgi:hypothetical protein